MYRHVNEAKLAGTMSLRTDANALSDQAVWDEGGPYNGAYDEGTTSTVVFDNCPEGMLWAKVMPTGWGADSFYVKPTGQSQFIWNLGGPTPNYQWRSVRHIPAGAVQIRTRELNTRLNCIAVLPPDKRPNDNDALASFGQEPPPPPPPPAKKWTHPYLGLGVPVDPGWPGWDTVDALFNPGWYWTWQAAIPNWGGVPTDMIEDDRFVPTAWGREDRLHLEQLTGEYAWLNDGVRPLFCNNEPELGGKMSPREAADYLRQCAEFWEGPIFGLGTLTRLESRNYLRAVMSEYGSGWPLTGWTVHVYSNVDHESWLNFLTEMAIEDAITKLERFRDEFGGPIVVNEYGGLTEKPVDDPLRLQIPEWKKVRLFEILYEEMLKIDEVVAVSPFSSWFSRYPTGNHIEDIDVTVLGALYNHLK